MSGCRNFFYFALFMAILAFLASLSENANNARSNSSVRVVATVVTDREATSSGSRGGTSSTHASATRTAQRSNVVAINRFSSPRERYVHGTVNLRSGPGKTYGRVGAVGAGAALQLLGQSGDWYLIKHQGRDAYIASWLTHNSPPAPPSRQESQPQQPSYSCNCSKTCGAMSSCQEAYYQLNNCGCGRRDGDNDGVPCESICR